MSETKKCRRCEEEQPLKAFSPNKESKDRLAYWCMACKVAATKAGPNRKATVKAYRDKNKAVCSARSMLSMAKKPEYYAEKARAWVAENHERVLANRRAYYAKNSGKEILRVRKRQKRLADAPAWLTQAHRAEMDGMYLFCQIFKGFEVDHIIPLNGKLVSGLHVPENLQVLTVQQNRRKGAKFMVEAVVDDPRGITRV